MSDYIKHTWEDGDIVDAPKMNNIETGIVEARQAAEKVGLQLSKLVNSDEDTLAELQKLVNYINENKDLIDEISASKVNITDIVNNLVTNATQRRAGCCLEKPD